MPNDKLKLPGGGQGGRNSPIVGDNGVQTEPGDNAKFMALALEVMNLPKIDSADPVQVEERINEYFAMTIKADLKPTVAGLANALGVDRKTLWEWKIGRNRHSTHSNTIKKAYGFLEELWENYMLNGKINPVSGIFIAKNNYGYTDVQEHILTPNTPLGQELTKEQIRQAVEELPELPEHMEE